MADYQEVLAANVEALRTGQLGKVQPMSNYQYPADFKDYLPAEPMVHVSFGASICAEVEKLSPQPGDVLVLTLPRPTDSHSDLADKSLAQRIADATGCPVVLLRPGETLAQADPAEMAAAGWVRAPAGQIAVVPDVEPLRWDVSALVTPLGDEVDPPALVEAPCDA